jgi:hypothetical protein
MSTSSVVDLRKIEGPVYTGRDRGEALRVKFEMDKLDKQAEVVEVVIPDSTYTVSSSFFLGLFGPSVRICGSVGEFKAKFRFKAPEFLLPVIEGHAALALQGRAIWGN